MDANTHPLAYRLPVSSTHALIWWTISYAIAHPESVTDIGIAKAWQGDQADRRAAALLSATRHGRPIVLHSYAN
jgi:hypothetical protein